MGAHHGYTGTVAQSHAVEFGRTRMAAGFADQCGAESDFGDRSVYALQQHDQCHEYLGGAGKIVPWYRNVGDTCGDTDDYRADVLPAHGTVLAAQGAGQQTPSSRPKPRERKRSGVRT